MKKSIPIQFVCILLVFSACSLMTLPEPDPESDPESRHLAGGKILVPVDVLSERDAGTCTITATTNGNTPFVVENAFRGDGDASIYRTENVNPAVVTLSFTSPREIARVRVFIGQRGYPDIDADLWSFEAADSVADLDSKSGTWIGLVSNRGEVRGAWDEASFTAPPRNVFRFTVTRTVGEGYVHVPELELYETEESGGKSLIVSKLSLKLYENWNYRHLPRSYEFTTASGKTVKLPAATFSGWSSSDESVVSLGNPLTDSDAPSVLTHRPGTATVTAANGPFKVRINVAVRAAAAAPVHETLSGYLAEPKEDAVYEIPVIILSFVPTKDLRKIDTTYAPDFWEIGSRTVARAKADVWKYSTLIKYAMEEGSRYHGYKDPGAPSSLGFRVVDFITVYEPLPPGASFIIDPNGHPVYGLDYDLVFERFGIDEKIENEGVKEVWIWSGGLDSYFPSYDPRIHRPEYFRGTPESNMASPVTGDISNSYRIPDMPVYSKTYIVYHHNFYRTQTTNMEPRTHQLENMFTHANWINDPSAELFVTLFVGRNGPNGEFRTGRAGWSHMPPNTTIDYGYYHYIQVNLGAVESDIEDWRPDGSGEKKLIDRHAWEDLTYDWPDGYTEFEERLELQWFIYWMQNMPGYGNSLVYNGRTLRNWWEVYADWEELARSGNLSLWY